VADKDPLEDGRRKKSLALVRFHRGTLAIHHGEIAHRLFTQKHPPLRGFAGQPSVYCRHPRVPETLQPISTPEKDKLGRTAIE
jgi:hypothetical protein